MSSRWWINQNTQNPFWRCLKFGFPGKFPLNKKYKPGRHKPGFNFLRLNDWKMQSSFFIEKSIRFAFNTCHHAEPNIYFRCIRWWWKARPNLTFVNCVVFFSPQNFLSRKSKKDFRFSHSLFGFTGADWFIVRFAIISADWIETLLCHSTVAI